MKNDVQRSDASLEQPPFTVWYRLAKSFAGWKPLCHAWTPDGCRCLAAMLRPRGVEITITRGGAEPHELTQEDYSE